MIVGLDYDLTYTMDPDCWNVVIDTLRTFGHTVIVVTCRNPEDTGNQISSGKIHVPNCPVYYTSGTPKDWYMMRHHGINVTVWIDDDPRSILLGK